MSEYPARPQTPQAMLHRLPDKPQSQPKEVHENSKPSKYIILIVASTAVAGKAQIAKSVADALACPLFHGDSLHETSARAASVGTSMTTSRKGDEDDQSSSTVTEPNKERYQRMWLSKMMRTGLLFPEESRPATEGFSGFGGISASGTPSFKFRQGSSSGDAAISTVASSSSSSSNNNMHTYPLAGEPQRQPRYINKPPLTVTLSDDENLRKANPALMVITHPILEQWHKDSIRHAVGDYSIAVIFVPLDQEHQELPVLRPLDPRTMTRFESVNNNVLQDTTQKTVMGASLHVELVLNVDTELKVEDLSEEVIEGVRDIMNA